MCMTCGCGRPNDDMGNADNLTWDDLQKAADAAEITPQQALDNMQETMAKV